MPAKSIIHDKIMMHKEGYISRDNILIYFTMTIVSIAALHIQVAEIKPDIEYFDKADLLIYDRHGMWNVSEALFLVVILQIT